MGSGEGKVPVHHLTPGFFNKPIQLFRDNSKALEHLTPIAERILSICPTSAASERNWSTFKYIWSDSRNRLLLGRVALLVFIYYNHRVLKATSSAPDWEAFLYLLDQLPPIPGLQQLGKEVVEVVEVEAVEVVEVEEDEVVEREEHEGEQPSARAAQREGPASTAPEGSSGQQGRDDMDE